jgi:hypothetical protein
MGAHLSASGISVQIYDQYGNPETRVYHGMYTFLNGRKQKDILQTAPTKPIEQGVEGSSDWLTVIVVADSQAKLDSIKKEPDVAALANAVGDYETSGSSRRVLLVFDVDGVRKSFQNALTIASGGFESFEPKKFNVVHVKVLPAETDLHDDRHPLKKEWLGMTFALE